MKANNLIAKDANGLSDPYCLMCVLGKEHIDSKLIRNHNMAEWMEQKIIDGEIARTTVKEKTLNPIWDETFEIHLTDPREQYLVIELWDRDEELRTKVKGFKGFGRLIADLTMEDDFLGRVFFLLQHVPVGGVTKTLDLLSHSAKHSRGSLTMHMEITGSAGDKSIQDIHILHKNLLKCITLHESKEERRWNGVLSELAERLLSYHVSLYKMTPLHQSAMYVQ
jgi:BAI1-associated protein 3